MKKIILYSIVLFSTLGSVVPAVSAQSAVKWVPAKNRAIIARPGEFDIQVGDTVVISKDQCCYLSGDTIRKWVYNVCVVVEKIGGPRFPNGILLQNIHSWVAPSALSLVGAAHVAQPKPAPVVPAPVAPAPIVEPEPEPEPVAPAPVAPAPIVEPEPEPVVPAPIVEPEPEPVVPAPVAEPKQEKQHISRFTIGVRGGATPLQEGVFAKCCPSTQVGFEALLDVQYAYYGCVSEHRLGFLTGVSADYTRFGTWGGVVYDQYTLSTSDGDIQYTTSADGISEIFGSVLVEVPFMFSFVSKQGVFLNIGPRLQMPVYSHYTMNWNNADIEAYFLKEKVTMRNELITGRVAEKEAKGTFTAPKLRLLAGVEFGYEWTLKNGDAVGLGAYANYAAYALQDTPTNTRMIQVTPPSATVQPAQVELQPTTYTKNLGTGFFDCGVKLAYHFNWVKQNDESHRK